MSASNSISTQANAAVGWDKIYRKQTSILGHHLGLPLFYLFYCLEGRNDPKVADNLSKIEYLRKYIADVDTSNFDDLKCLFKICLDSKKRRRQMENDLTGAFAANLIKQHAAVQLTCRTEVSVDEQGNNQVDVLLTSDSALNRNEAVLLFEIGWDCRNHHWWKKADQALIYLDQMAKNKRSGRAACFGKKPMLLAVVAIERDVNERFKLGQIAVFLCWHKGLNDLSLSLLWRRKTKNAAEMSKAIAFTIMAGQHLDKWCNSGHPDFPCADRNCTDFAYLGPNCCRVRYNSDQDMVRCFVARGQRVACRSSYYMHQLANTNRCSILLASGSTVFRQSLSKYGSKPCCISEYCNISRQTQMRGSFPHL